MRIDNETGNITHVDYESYQEKKEEYEAEIEKLKQENEDLQDRVAELEEQLEEENDNVKFFLKIAKTQQMFSEFMLNQFVELKKDSVATTNESK